MVECIVGRKGKGKTKHLLERVRLHMAHAKGSLVYLDKSAQHIYELNNQVRLIDTNEYLIDNHNQFLGFICGILSQDHDIEVMFLDSFLTISHCEKENLPAAIQKLEEISRTFQVDFVLSISADLDELPDDIYENVAISL